MIRATELLRDGNMVGFSLSGHAGYAEEGMDIVCSAVSALTINTVNSIEAFTEDPMIVEEAGEEGGYLRFVLTDVPSQQARLLLKSLGLGLKAIEETYGSQHLVLERREAEETEADV